MSASSDSPMPWAPRLKPDLIRRLYVSDAGGFEDGVLVDDVGIGLLARCESIHRATKRLCPVCGGSLQGAWGSGRSRLLSCSCGWEATWARYHQSYRTACLHAGRAYVGFNRFRTDYPACRTYRQKMATIDQLIHALHEWAKGTLTFPAAYNLIQASREQTFDFLENLAYGDQRVSQSDSVRSEYFERIAHSPATTRREGELFEKLHEHLAGETAALLGEYLDDPATSGIAYIDRCTYWEFVESLVDPACSFSFSLGSGPAVIAYDPTAQAFATGGDSGRRPGAKGLDVMERLVVRSLTHIADTWSSVTEFEAASPVLETDREQMEAVEPDDPVYLVAVEIVCGSSTGQVIVCYPEATIESALQKLMHMDL